MLRAQHLFCSIGCRQNDCPSLDPGAALGQHTNSQTGLPLFELLSYVPVGLKGHGLSSASSFVRNSNRGDGSVCPISVGLHLQDSSVDVMFRKYILPGHPENDKNCYVLVPQLSNQFRPCSFICVFVCLLACLPIACLLPLFLGGLPVIISGVRLYVCLNLFVGGEVFFLLFFFRPTSTIRPSGFATGVTRGCVRFHLGGCDANGETTHFFGVYVGLCNKPRALSRPRWIWLIGSNHLGPGKGGSIPCFGFALSVPLVRLEPPAWVGFFPFCVFVKPPQKGHPQKRHPFWNSVVCKTVIHLRACRWMLKKNQWWQALTFRPP